MLFSTIAGVLPVFLLGALAVQIGSDLRIGNVGLGLAVTTFFVTSSLVAAPGGRLVDKVGWRTALRIGVLGSSVALGGMGMARSVYTLIPFLVLGGALNAMSMATGNLALTAEMPAHRQGLLFGLKQTAVPIATMLAGLSVPLVALTLGWRWSFYLVLAVPLVALILIPESLAVDTDRRDTSQPAFRTDKHLVRLALAGGCGTVAIGALNAFTVLSAVDAGMSVGAAGVLVAVASGVGLLVRVGAGWLIDRVHVDGLRAVALLMGVGSVGFLAMASGVPTVVTAGTVVAFGGAWGWPGLFFFGVVRRHPAAAGAATGVVQSGLSVGTALGPLIFGLLSRNGDYGVGWLVVAALTAFAAVVVGKLSAGTRGTRRAGAQ